MKKFRRLSCLLLAVVMVFALGATAMAVNITIDYGSVEGASYAAYKLLNATNATVVDGEDTTELFAYTLNEKYTTILQSVTGKTSQADIIDYIASLTTEDAIRTFANSVYSKIAEDSTITADYTAAENVISNADQGYCLIVETSVGTTTGDTYSLVLLDTAGDTDITVTTKESAPTLTKKVDEVNDSDSSESATLVDAADYDIGDTIQFTLTGTVSSYYANYTSYAYTFHDNLASSLEYAADSVVVKIDGTTIDSNKYTVSTSNR